jgi:hypothetical protein
MLQSSPLIWQVSCSSVVFGQCTHWSHVVLEVGRRTPVGRQALLPCNQPQVLHTWCVTSRSSRVHRSSLSSPRGNPAALGGKRCCWLEAAYSRHVHGAYVAGCVFVHYYHMGACGCRACKHVVWHALMLTDLWCGMRCTYA